MAHTLNLDDYRAFELISCATAAECVEATGASLFYGPMLSFQCSGGEVTGDGGYEFCYIRSTIYFLTGEYCSRDFFG